MGFSRLCLVDYFSSDLRMIGLIGATTLLVKRLQPVRGLSRAAACTTAARVRSREPR